MADGDTPVLPGSAPSTSEATNALMLNQTIGRLLDTFGSNSTSVIAAINAIAAAVTASLVGGTTGTTANLVLRSKGTGGFALQPSPLFSCDNSGNVGIGTVAANAALDVFGVDEDTLRLSNTGDATDYYKIGRDTATGYLHFSGVQASFTGYRFFKNTSELALIIDNSGNVSIGGTTPTARLDVLGSWATRAIALTLSNGANSDIVITNGAYARISGPTGAFSVSGFAGGVDGRRLTIYNSTAQNMTLTNNATSTAANRIFTLSGADITLTGTSAASFIYDSTDSRWILVGTQA